MRKQVFGRHLKRDTNERKALFKALASSLVLHERIETTEQKAKAIKGQVEKMVTKAKKDDSNHTRDLLRAHLSHDALIKLMSDIAPRFVDRPGGYTRIVKKGNRFSDNASMVFIEWVEKGPKTEAIHDLKESKPRTKKIALSKTATSAKEKKSTKKQKLHTKEKDNS
ncbi:MAG: 50S ribosomal protein L17 [Candidatus Levybacteria bacterium]|nr:50S ribosomal protein L17 [Candidatus Levybacteria bacterium]